MENKNKQQKNGEKKFSRMREKQQKKPDNTQKQVIYIKVERMEQGEHRKPFIKWNGIITLVLPFPFFKLDFWIFENWGYLQF